MKSLQTRIKSLEEQAGESSGWHGVAQFVEVRSEDDPEAEAKIAAIKAEATAKGWTPECGRPCVIIVEMQGRSDEQANTTS